MDGAIVFGVLLLLAFPIITIVALVMGINTRDRLRQLQQRVAVLEAGQAAAPIAAVLVEPAAPIPAKFEPVAVIEEETVQADSEEGKIASRYGVWKNRRDEKK